VLVKLTIDGAPSRSRAKQGRKSLRIGANFGSSYDPPPRFAREHTHSLRAHTQFTAAHIACTGNGDEWHPESEPLYARTGRGKQQPAELTKKREVSGLLYGMRL